MIEFSRRRYLTDAKEHEFSLEFTVADAGDPSTMKPHWQSKFDLLVSFCAMQWVQDQRKVLQNFWFCLNEGGLVLMLFPFRCDAFRQSELLSRE